MSVLPHLLSAEDFHLDHLGCVDDPSSFLVCEREFDLSIVTAELIVCGSRLTRHLVC